MKPVACVLLVCLSSLSLVRGSRWGYYDDHGLPPQRWFEHYPTCGENRQSPINIVTSDVQDDEMGDFTFSGYDSEVEGFVLSNNGHTVVASNSQLSASINGGGLNARYNFAQFHVHWGSQITLGSEHQVNGKSYPAEIHLVHLRDDSVNTKLADQNTIAVIGIFVEVTDDDDDDNDDVAAVFDNVASVSLKGQSVQIGAFPLENLLPDDIDEFYRYEGSLTTPGCDESVIWTVMKNPISISQSQLDALRVLYSGTTPNSSFLVDNFRPVQKLNGRTILGQ